MIFPAHKISGGEALAYGAAKAGIGCLTSYPGSPSSKTVATLIELVGNGEGKGCHVEWSTNERVALEVAIGTCLGGIRSLVCTKSVGLNVMLDPLMALNLTPLSAGLVIILGDDPGAYGSQNDQDSRPLADLIELPMIEPATPQIGLNMVVSAFAVSERSGLPVIIRITRSFDVCTEVIDSLAGSLLSWQVNFGHVSREPFRYMPYPGNAVEKHRDLHRRLQIASVGIDSAEFNHCTKPSSGSEDRVVAKRGVITAGFCSSKFAEVFPAGEKPAESLIYDDQLTKSGVGLLELGSIFPLPSGLVKDFLSQYEEVIVFEENEPYLEHHISSLAHVSGLKTAVRGKLTGDVERCGELYRWQITQALSKFTPKIPISNQFSPMCERLEYPAHHDYCAGCPTDELVGAIQLWLNENGRDAWLIVDPGCLSHAREKIDAKYAIGSAISVANGLLHAGQDAVALFGDSAFFHSALPALCNAHINSANLTVIVVDNDGPVTTGRQPHPSSGRSALGAPAPRLDILDLARACGANYARRVPLSKLSSVLSTTMGGIGLRVLVVEASCKHI